MSPERQPKWLSKEPVKTADVEFQQSLEASPFEGSVAIGALANFIDATKTIRAMRRPAVTPEEATAQIIARITAARETAAEANQETYAQLFEAQLQGWEATERILQGEAAPQEAPTQTAKKPMSGGKSNPS